MSLLCIVYCVLSIVDNLQALGDPQGQWTGQLFKAKVTTMDSQSESESEKAVNNFRLCDTDTRVDQYNQSLNPM